MDMVQTIGLTKTYGSGENIVRALDGINLSVRPGEFCRIGRSVWFWEEHTSAHAWRSGSAYIR